MPFIYVGAGLMLIGYGGLAFLRVRDVVRERRARKTCPQLPPARVQS